MTTQTTEADRRPWWRVIGPWPLYPLADGIISALIALSVRSFLMSAQTAPMEILTASIFGFIIFAVLEAIQRYLPAVPRSFIGYVLTLLVAITLATAVRYFQGYVPDYPTLTSAEDFAFAVVRLLVGILILQAIIGTLQERLQRQVDVTQEALDLVEAQAEALLRADEEVRRSVATLLHDRVQGGLLAACLRLQQVARESTETRIEVERVIHELEQLRALDVRRAVRVLSPSLKDVDLETAIREMAEPYAPALSVTIDIPRGAVQDPTVRLAVYRIVEQGMLNAIDHGEARSLRVTVARPVDAVELTVTDDGRGLAGVHKPGFGTMLVDTWCRTLGGTWDLRARPGGGAVLSARLPAGSG